MPLLRDDTLEASPVVANCRMNRERDLAGSNGYARELRLHPLHFLREQCERRGTAAWLDLCCGTGRALIQAAEQLRTEGHAARVEIVGVDLVDLFAASVGLDGLRLEVAALGRWEPTRPFDLVTCVHGLHYVGDKLGAIARAAAWLTEDGLFLGHLDLANFKLAEGRPAGRRIVATLRANGLTYERRQRLVACRGRKEVDLPFRYLGADDGAGPNFTGQPAVDSYYASR